MNPYLIRFSIGILPSIRLQYRCKKAFDEAEDVPSHDPLVRKILGENHKCRVNYSTKDDDDAASASGSSLFGYPVVHMTKNAFENDEGAKAHELCHIRNHDGLFSKFLLGMTYACISSALHKSIPPSKYFALRIGQKILKEGFSVCSGFGTFIAFERFNEKRADLMGFSYCSKEGQRRYIQSFQESQKIGIGKEEEIEALNDYKRNSEMLAQYEEQLKHLMELSEDNQRASDIENLRFRIQFTTTLLHCEEAILKKNSPKYLFWGMIPVAGTAENGDDLGDWGHPPLSERVKYLTNAYREIHGEDPFG
jgi:hypothetical protein